LFLFHSKKSFIILMLLYIMSGAILWLIGRQGTNHIGASGLIYALAFFLFTAGAIIKDRSSVAVSFFIILWYGSMIWGIFPFSVEAGTSWEGHLGGAISGIFLALILIKKPIEEHQLEDFDEDEHFYEKHRLE
jgi:membrane associated rhomboid family serine protease